MVVLVALQEEKNKYSIEVRDNYIPPQHSLLHYQTLVATSLTSYDGQRISYMKKVCGKETSVDRYGNNFNCRDV